LTRPFGIEIEPCARCGGQLDVIASLEEPALIGRVARYTPGAAQSLRTEDSFK
jgi:hypothetical protein